MKLRLFILLAVALLTICILRRHWDNINIPLSINYDTERIYAHFDIGEINSKVKLLIDLNANLSWISNSKSNLSNSCSLFSEEANVNFRYFHYDFIGDIASECFFYDDWYFNFCSFALVYSLPSPYIYEKGILALGHNTKGNYSLTQQLKSKEAIAKNVFSIQINKTAGTLSFGDDSLLDCAKNNKKYECNIHNTTSPNWNCYIKHIAVSIPKSSTQQETYPYAVDSIVEFRTNKAYMYVPINIFQHITEHIFSDRLKNGICYEMSDLRRKEIICKKSSLNKENKISFIIDDFKVTFSEDELFTNEIDLINDNVKFNFVCIRNLKKIEFGISFISKIAMAFDNDNQKIRMYQDSLLSSNDFNLNESSSSSLTNNDNKKHNSVYLLISFLTLSSGALVLLFIIIHYKKKKMHDTYYNSHEILLNNGKLPLAKD